MDIGLNVKTKGSRIFAVLAGAVKAGMIIPHNEKIFPVQVRPRKTWHGGNDPSALRKVKDLEEGENPFLKKIQEQINELKEID